MSKKETSIMVVLYTLAFIAGIITYLLYSGVLWTQPVQQDTEKPRWLSQSEHGTGLEVTPTDTGYAGFQAMQENTATFLQKTTNPQESE